MLKGTSLSLKEMALIRKKTNKKTYESKNLTGKGKYIVKVVNQLVIKQVWRLKAENSKKLTKITIISSGMHKIKRCKMRHQRYKKWERE